MTNKELKQELTDLYGLRDDVDNEILLEAIKETFDDTEKLHNESDDAKTDLDDFEDEDLIDEIRERSLETEFLEDIDDAELVEEVKQREIEDKFLTNLEKKFLLSELKGFPIRRKDIIELLNFNANYCIDNESFIKELLNYFN